MTTTFFTYADALVKRKRKAGKYSTADLYRASSNWLLRFWGTDKLSFDAITPGMIDRFYDWLLALGHLKTNSVNSYLSSFRAIYHTAVREELAPADRLSPFAHLNLRQEETAKRALRIQTMEEIARMDLSAEPELQAAKDFALFSFLACGMPFIDLAHLTRDNIVDNELVYNRCKTGVLVRVGITPGMQRLFDKYVLSDSRYLFPVLPEKAEGERLHEAYKQALHHYNGCLVEDWIAPFRPGLPHLVRLSAYLGDGSFVQRHAGSHHQPGTRTYIGANDTSLSGCTRPVETQFCQ